MFSTVASLHWALTSSGLGFNTSLLCCLAAFERLKEYVYFLGEDSAIRGDFSLLSGLLLGLIIAALAGAEELTSLELCLAVWNLSMLLSPLALPEDEPNLSTYYYF